MNSIINHPIFIISSYLIGLISTLSGIYFYLKSKVKKQLSYYVMHFDLFTNTIHEVSKLSLHYDNKEILNLTISEVYIWNSGNSYLDQQDIAPLAPILIKSKEGEIFECTLPFITDKDNNWKVEESENSKIISFDYLPPSHGCKIKIAHTGKTLSISGKLKQSDIKYQKVMPLRKDGQSLKSDKRFFLFFLAVSIIAISGGYIFNSSEATSMGIVISPLAIFAFMAWQINRIRDSSISVFKEFRYGKED